MSRYFSGIWAGLIATGPMTLAFFNFFKMLPARDRKPLPPAELTQNFEEQLNMKPAKDETHANLTMLSHFGYGAISGLLYALTLEKLKAPKFLKGSLFGLGVWAASYKGWIPAVGFHPQSKEMSFPRNSMMVVSHLIWGACLSYATQELSRSGNKMLRRTQVNRN